LLRSVLRDLCDSHLIFQSGQGTQAVYRAASDDELRALHALSFGEQEGFIVAWPQGIDDAWNIGTCCTTSPHW